MKITIELNDVQDLHDLKKIIQTAAPETAEPVKTPEPAEPVKTPEPQGESEKPEKTEEPVLEKPEDTPPWEEEPKTVTLSELRKKGTELTKAGKLPELQAVFAEFGAKKLSQIAESDYQAVMKKLEEL